MSRHELLIDTAFDGARAIAAGRNKNGTPLSRTMDDTFAR